MVGVMTYGQSAHLYTLKHFCLLVSPTDFIAAITTLATHLTRTAHDLTATVHSVTFLAATVGIVSLAALFRGAQHRAEEERGGRRVGGDYEAKFASVQLQVSHLTLLVVAGTITCAAASRAGGGSGGGGGGRRGW